MSSPVIGLVFSLLAALGFGLFGVFARPAMLQATFSVGVMVSALVGWLAVAIVGAFLIGPALFQISLSDLGWFAFLALVNLVLGRLFNLSAIRRIGVSRSAPLIGATPLLAALLALLLYHESISLLLALGAVSVVAGVILILKETG